MYYTAAVVTAANENTVMSFSRSCTTIRLPSCTQRTRHNTEQNMYIPVNVSANVRARPAEDNTSGTVTTTLGGAGRCCRCRRQGGRARARVCERRFSVGHFAIAPPRQTGKRSQRFWRTIMRQISGGIGERGRKRKSKITMRRRTKKNHNNNNSCTNVCFSRRVWFLQRTHSRRAPQSTLYVYKTHTHTHIHISCITCVHVMYSVCVRVWIE